VLHPTDQQNHANITNSSSDDTQYTNITCPKLTLIASLLCGDTLSLIRAATSSSNRCRSQDPNKSSGSPHASPAAAAEEEIRGDEGDEEGLERYERLEGEVQPRGRGEELEEDGGVVEVGARGK
jgi:hypothetical protein